jgi:predicted DNA-binding protein with PD1-like motif
MHHQLLHNDHGQRTFAVVLQTGEEAMDCLQEFVRAQQVSAAQLTGIGAFADVTLGYFDWNKKDYVGNSVPEQVEVASMIGDVALSPSGQPTLHIHVVVGRRDGTAFAGHLQKAHVRPTLEVILNESPVHLRKVHDPESGLALIRPNP